MKYIKNLIGTLVFFQLILLLWILSQQPSPTPSPTQFIIDKSQSMINSSVSLSQTTQYDIPFVDDFSLTTLPPILLQPSLRKTVTNAKLIVGIPTVVRPSRHDYLVSTLQRLIHTLTEEEKLDTKFVILVAMSLDEADKRLKLQSNITEIIEENLRQDVLKKLEVNFSSELEAGMIEVIESPPQLYLPLLRPNLCQLRRSFGDSLHRVVWRSKIVLDAAFLLLATVTEGEYHFRLEDDSPPVAGKAWRRDMLDKLKHHERPWIAFSAYHQLPRVPSIMAGSFGLLFQTKDLPLLARHLFENFDTAPLDWSMGAWIESMCNLRGINITDCLIFNKFIEHIGHVSSKSKSKEFEDKKSWIKAGCDTIEPYGSIKQKDWANVTFVKDQKKWENEPFWTSQDQYLTLPAWNEEKKK